MGSPYRHHRSVWWEESQGRPCACSKVATNFSGIAAVIKDNQDRLAGAQPAPRPPFLLKADSAAPLERAEFLCGVFGSNGQTADSAVFVLNNLPPGTYATASL